VQERELIVAANDCAIFPTLNDSFFYHRAVRQLRPAQDLFKSCGNGLPASATFPPHQGPRMYFRLD